MQNQVRYFSGQSTSSQSPSPAVVFFDGGCPLCASEIGLYQRMVKKHQITDLDFVDISIEESQPQQQQQHEKDNQLQQQQQQQQRRQHSLSDIGVTVDEAMARMHALDSHGKIQTGTMAFITMWEKLPYWKYIAKIVAVPGILQSVELVYTIWAKQRRRVTGGKEGIENDDKNDEKNEIVVGPGGSCRSTDTK